MSLAPNNGKKIDSATSRSICGAIGERLRRNMVPAETELPAHMRDLLDEMERREVQAAASPRRRG